VFGYVCVDASQLKMWEYELYKSTYCAICRHGGKHTTKLSRFFLSYDFVALALMRMMLTEETSEIKKYFCPYSPKRKNMIKPNQSIEYTADAFMILSYYKIIDDKNDSFGFKKRCKSIPLFLLRKKAMQAEKRNPTLSETVRFELNRLSRAEKEKCSSVDLVADCFAKLLAKTLSVGLEGDKKIVAHEIGYHVGRYIYIIDALDDYDEDLKKSRFNPIAQADLPFREYVLTQYPQLQQYLQSLYADYDTLAAQLQGNPENEILASILKNSIPTVTSIVLHQQPLPELLHCRSGNEWRAKQ
jgi:hypothetical protein